MKKNNNSRWIRHSHLFDSDDYECPVCGKREKQPFAVCRYCNNTISSPDKKGEPDWIEEAEELDWLLGDDD